MRQTGPSLVGGAPKTVSALAIVFLLTAACFGFFNSEKMRRLRADVANAHAVRDGAERTHGKLDASTGGTSAADRESKITEAENRAAKAEAELTQLQKEKA